MRNWVKWCINHKLKWFLWFLLIIMLPIYLFSYIKDGYNDWVYDTKWLKDAE